MKSLPEGTFDRVACRFMIMSFNFEQYKQLVAECLRVCKINGYVEIMEMDLRIYNQRSISTSVTQTLNSEGKCSIYRHSSVMCCLYVCFT